MICLGDKKFLWSKKSIFLFRSKYWRRKKLKVKWSEEYYNIRKIFLLFNFLISKFWNFFIIKRIKIYFITNSTMYTTITKLRFKSFWKLIKNVPNCVNMYAIVLIYVFNFSHNTFAFSTITWRIRFTFIIYYIWKTYYLSILTYFS